MPYHKKFLNKKQVVSVRTFDFDPAINYCYKLYDKQTSKSLFGCKINETEEGIYSKYFPYELEWAKDKIPGAFIIKGDVVLQKPRIIVTFADKTEFNKYFETLEEAVDFAEQFIDINFIEV